jgi:hypothetical protein
MFFHFNSEISWFSEKKRRERIRGEARKKQIIVVYLYIKQINNNTNTIGGQVRLVRFVRLQTDNFRLCDEQTVNGLRKNNWA